MKAAVQVIEMVFLHIRFLVRSTHQLSFFLARASDVELRLRGLVLLVLALLLAGERRS
jgi:hypothetical protein